MAYTQVSFLDGYYSSVQGLLDWFEVDSEFTELLFIQIDLCVMNVFVLYGSPFCICPGLFCVSLSLFHKLRSSLRCEVPFLFLPVVFWYLSVPFKHILLTGGEGIWPSGQNGTNRSGKSNLINDPKATKI